MELRVRDATPHRRRGGGADAAGVGELGAATLARRHRRRLDRARPRRLPDEPAAGLGSLHRAPRRRRGAPAVDACPRARCPDARRRRARSASRARSRRSPRSTSGSTSTTATRVHGHASRSTARARSSSGSPRCRSRSGAQVPALEPERAPVIVAGAAILVATLDASGSIDRGQRARHPRRRRVRRGRAAGAGRGRRAARRLHLLLEPAATGSATTVRFAHAAARCCGMSRDA